MDHACPACACSLHDHPPRRVRRPRRRLPLARGLACPRCAQRLRLNLHPWEHCANVLLFGVLLLALILGVHYHHPIPFVAAGVLALLAELASQHWQRRVPSWKRYTPAE